MSKKLKIVMIGAGDRANGVIYPSFSELEKDGKVEIVGICDIDPERLNETATKYNIKNRYGQNRYVYEYQKMIKEQKPDAAVVIGQPHIMYDIWAWCLENNLHLYIEKPLALSIHQARALTAIANKNNLVTQVSLQRRYCPMVTKIREKVLTHGQVTHAVCKFYKSDINDFLGARDHMMDDTVHAIDTLRWMVGSEIVEVESVCRKIDTVDINYIMAQLKFENGAVGYLMNNWSSGKRIFAVEMHSKGIFAEAEHETKGFVYENGNGEPTVYSVEEVAKDSRGFYNSGVYFAAKDFVDCCIANNGSRPMANFNSTIKTMEVAEIILAQALTKDFYKK